MRKIIAYDISSDRIRGRVSRALEKEGRRIQESVFLVDIDAWGYKKLLRNLEKLNEGNGIIHVFHLCRGCSEKTVAMNAHSEFVIIA